MYWPVRFSQALPMMPAARLIEAYRRMVMSIYLSIFFWMSDFL
jgi:hypothetical protein